ncbi:Similar to mth2: G-protein coupled receptor Mth2 (Drosophila simulans) [Cotesia congregata]|uniref:39S ribosomal protein L36, mitochondrial n=1 Tax=Cotesia congregata TaxID=51543 RepID=A0A8J2MQ40_COTCN|nr:Similar to mth2: G-protein coupled receptor Mth2 (Drosophila simulans) [Cotesia congregata]
MTASFLAAFTWLNVIGYNGIVYINRESLGRRKRFLLYSCYAWGLPLFSSLFIFMLDSKKFIPDEWLPHLGETTCWIGAQNDNLAKVIYFYGPLTILLTINVIFFILTLRNYSRVKASISKLSSFTSDQLDKATKTKVRITLKLFIVMGITWIFEVIGFFSKTYVISLNWHVIIFTVFDMINCLHGMFIFILFVVKTDVYRALIKKFNGHRPHLRFHRRSQKTNDLRNIFKNSRSVNSTSTQFHGLTQTLVTAANGQISGSNVCKNYLLQSVQPILNHTCGLKHKAILKRRCKDCFIYAIEGRWFVGCKTFGRHKQAQIVKKEKNTWMLTSVCQSKKRPWCLFNEFSSHLCLS